MSRGFKTIVGSILALLLAVAVVAFKNTRESSDHSAHAALTAEIFGKLENIPSGGFYPKALSDRVTNCTVTTLLRGQELTRSFP